MSSQIMFGSGFLYESQKIKEGWIGLDHMLVMLSQDIIIRPLSFFLWYSLLYKYINYIIIT